MQGVATSESPASRARLLEAARRHFERFGYRRTNVAGIARDAGVAAGTLYRHFDSKEELFRCVVAQCREEWMAIARRVLAEPLPALERLVRLGDATVRFGAESLIHRSILTRDAEIIFAPLLDELSYEFGRITVEAMSELLREAVADGEIRAVDPRKTAIVLFLAGAALMEQERFPREDVMPVYRDLVLNGLLPR